MATALLDVRSLSPDEARVKIVDALAASEGGEETIAEVLCVARSADDLRATEPSPDDRSPFRRCVLAVAGSEVLLAVRRKAVEPETSVEVHMKREHGRALALLALGAEAVERGDALKARVYFSTLAQLLGKHIEVEEDLLLPVLSARFAQPRGPAAVLRGDHVVILDLLTRLVAAAMAEPVPISAVAIARALEQKLRSHMETEEGLIYRLSDDHLDEDERASLIDFCRTMV